MAKELIPILRNKRYIGIYTYRETEVPDGLPRIVSDDLFYEIFHSDTSLFALIVAWEYGFRKRAVKKSMSNYKVFSEMRKNFDIPHVQSYTEREMRCWR